MACAQQVLKQHGGCAPLHIANRIGELATAGDSAGVDAWKYIASRVDQLMDYRSGQPSRRQ
ncbi:DUF6961 family protein [Sphingobium sp. EP60837]|uniref:DUF6961 family protein n=1 Tax=Sphingobium sp. EP60837 TaxID=1855519 RepID=UPI003FA6DA29